MATYMILGLHEQKPQIDVIQCFIDKTEEEAQETFNKFIAKASNLYPNISMFQLNKQEMISKHYPSPADKFLDFVANTQKGEY